MIKKIGVFCSASDNIDAIYFESARQLGEWMGKENKMLVYGGTALGLMEQIARAVKENGGNVVGIVPVKIKESNLESTLSDQTIDVSNLSERKDLMLQKSDIMVALPGGIGTLDEVFHVMAAATIGDHTKKIVFYNINGFYDLLWRILNDMKTNHFITGELSDYCNIANSFEELKLFLL
ncbi:TIGR00730 family Rossman fold protein [termite gut metagenome]|uniref:TIGR00730 family Rossman fold protein n=1 Tax=termite gut metagenome TaxID=433724 RepID=A0A5J4T124_9ZZZZ